MFHFVAPQSPGAADAYAAEPSMAAFAEQLRSEGQGVRAEIEGQKEKELKRIQSEAYRTAQKIKGEGDATATKIYGDAYSKDPAFYALIATLEKYPAALTDARLVLTTDSDFLQYLKEVE